MTDLGTQSVRDAARAVLESHWRIEGYTVPNARVYPYQWLWDSCFHAIVWAELGEADRARAELAHLFRTQNAEGFVPHMDYEFDPDAHADLWGRSQQSCITQPPMFGHAIRELSVRGIDVEDLLAPAALGLRFLLEVRPRVDGLVSLCHPWESGADNCPRWDSWCPEPWGVDRWRARKDELVTMIEFSPMGSPLANPGFVVGSCGFSALVAFNALELAEVSGDAGLRALALDLCATLDTRWDPDLRTWIDTGDAAAGSGRIRVLDALLPVLVPGEERRRAAVLDDLLDATAFGGRCGPAGVHRDEPMFAPLEYWRGAAWPQLTYLCMVAAQRAGRSQTADALALMLVEGATRSGWAEYWSPDDGTACGAVPQSWAALAVLASN